MLDLGIDTTELRCAGNSCGQPWHFRKNHSRFTGKLFRQSIDHYFHQPSQLYQKAKQAVNANQFCAVAINIAADSYWVGIKIDDDLCLAYVLAQKVRCHTNGWCVKGD